MIRLSIILIVSIFIQGASWAQDAFFLGAVHVQTTQDDNYFPAVAECGFDLVQLTRYAKQENWDKGNLVDTNKMSLFVEQLEKASAEGMKAAFVPRVHLEDNERNQFLWHGMILPQSETEIKNWFKQYWTFLKPYLIQCEKYEVSIVAIASELNALVETRAITKLPGLYRYNLSSAKQWASEGAILKHRDKISDSHLTKDGLLLRDELKNLLTIKINQNITWAKQVSFSEAPSRIDKINQRRALLTSEWSALISKVRSVYSGKLIYAANFDSYQEVAFWDQLDYIGINAYFPLTKYKPSCGYNCKLKEASKSWSSHLNSITKFMKAQNLSDRQVVFTELGYSAFQGSTYQPWKADGFTINSGYVWDDFIDWSTQKKAPSERLAALSALHESIEKTNFPLVGIMYWELSNDPKKLAVDPFGLKPVKTIPMIKKLRTFKQ